MSKYRRMTDEEYTLARSRRYERVEDCAADMSARRAERCCCICGAESGVDPLLPAGWSYARWSEMFAEKVGDPRAVEGVAAFFCDRCTENLGLEEARNYGQDHN